MIMTPARARTRATLEAMSMPASQGQLVSSHRFDVDAWHAMNERDNQLVRDEIAHGVAGTAFVYNFKVSGTPVIGVSVVGARQLARYVGGLQHRIVASADKRGSLFTFTQYPGEGTPMQVSCATVAELEDEPDHYRCLVEIKDIKTGNVIQMECSEDRWGTKRDGEPFAREHYQKIAQSKAYRNAVLALVDQAALSKWKERCLQQKAAIDISTDVLAEKCQAIMRYATSRGLSLDPLALQKLQFEQISGLREAAQEGSAAFLAALRAVGLTQPLAVADGEAADDERRQLEPSSKGHRRSYTEIANDIISDVALCEGRDQVDALVKERRDRFKLNAEEWARIDAAAQARRLALQVPAQAEPQDDTTLTYTFVHRDPATGKLRPEELAPLSFVEKLAAEISNSVTSDWAGIMSDNQTELDAVAEHNPDDRQIQKMVTQIKEQVASATQ